jgi:hypothetical protein
MMIKATLLSIGMVAFGAIACIAQSNNNPVASDSVRSSGGPLGTAPLKNEQFKVPACATNWGASVQGVQLLIYMTNTIVQREAIFTVLAVITNSSTNTITLSRSQPQIDYDVFLVSGTGNSYELTPRPRFMRLSGQLKLAPREQNGVSVPLAIGMEREQGDYTVKAIRRFGVDGKVFVVESNALKVNVK